FRVECAVPVLGQSGPFRRANVRFCAEAGTGRGGVEGQIAMAHLPPARDVPANPLEKPGYALEFHDEFDGPDIDPEKWLPFYLPHWSSRAQSAPRYTLQDSCLVLQITRDQQPWCPEFDG